MFMAARWPKRSRLKRYSCHAEEDCWAQSDRYTCNSHRNVREIETTTRNNRESRVGSSVYGSQAQVYGMSAVQKDSTIHMQVCSILLPGGKTRMGFRCWFTMLFLATDKQNYNRAKKPHATAQHRFSSTSTFGLEIGDGLEIHKALPCQKVQSNPMSKEPQQRGRLRLDPALAISTRV